VQRAIRYFGYAPEIIQTDTDNGGESMHTGKTKRMHPLDVLYSRLHIIHKTIRPRTPWHNGKVERSHRRDQERFYNYLSFYSYEDLQIQMKQYLRRSNRIPMSVLGWKTPIQKRQELETAALMNKLFLFSVSHH
ncbi:MAG: integrase core domain-containing protein, partial [Oscillospiraceae bacterium]|nr:integrase core domain-containing protein [Oscillospiraceae bacterium]